MSIESPTPPNGITFVRWEGGCSRGCLLLQRLLQGSTSPSAFHVSQSEPLAHLAENKRLVQCVCDYLVSCLKPVPAPEGGVMRLPRSLRVHVWICYGIEYIPTIPVFSGNLSQVISPIRVAQSKTVLIAKVLQQSHNKLSNPEHETYAQHW